MALIHGGLASLQHLAEQYQCRWGTPWTRRLRHLLATPQSVRLTLLLRAPALPRLFPQAWQGTPVRT
ncbi:hypothetical protein [Citrobacter koseri]|uniref:hypothetical protein n=1 Tax=Citrobacter koseri TaxID=545 RepID=UPI0015F29400|nr:hypothetical protein [Citrobacter koseri]